MRRAREYHIVLNRLLRDERLNPNRALLAVALSMLTDAEGDEVDLIKSVLATVWGNPKMVRWSDEDDPRVPNPSTERERDQAEQIKSVWDSLLPAGEGKNAS